MVHGPARPAPGCAGGPQASSLLRSNVDALGRPPIAAGRPRAPDVDAPPAPRTWAPRHHQHALACLDDLQQGMIQLRPITASGHLDVDRGGAIAPPRAVLSNDTHTRPGGRGFSRSDAALPRQAITSRVSVPSVTAPGSRERGPRFSPVILRVICNEHTGSDARGTYAPPNPSFGRRLRMLAGGADLELGCQEEGRGADATPDLQSSKLSCPRQDRPEATVTGLLKPERSPGRWRGDRIKGATGGPHACSPPTYQGLEPLLRQSR